MSILHCTGIQVSAKKLSEYHDTQNAPHYIVLTTLLGALRAYYMHGAVLILCSVHILHLHAALLTKFSWIVSHPTMQLRLYRPRWPPHTRILRDTHSPHGVSWIKTVIGSVLDVAITHRKCTYQLWTLKHSIGAND